MSRSPNRDGRYLKRTTRNDARYVMKSEFLLQRAAFATRRQFLKQAGALGIGAMALSSMLQEKARAATPGGAVDPLAVRPPHYPGKAKRVIFLHMSGGPPHLDMFDYKPELVKRDDQPCPDSLLKGKTFAFTSGVPRLLGTPQVFNRYGQSG